MNNTMEFNKIDCNCTDEEMAKSFIDDVETVEDQLPCGNQMDFPATFDEFAKDYGFKDKEEIYTNGAELISVFRVKQWLEHISTIKNNLDVDLIDRAEAQTEIEMNACRYTIAKERGGMGKVEWSDILIKVSDAIDIIRNLPPATPKPKWIPTREEMPKPNEIKNSVAVHYLVETEYSDIYVAMWDGEHWRSTIHPLEVIKDKIVAWMPTPEKYMGKEVL